MRDNDTKLLEEAYDQIQQEGVGSEVGHVLLDIAGLGVDFFGGQGAWFDAANALWYAKEKNYLFAALSLISAIPVIGDVIGKGGKYLWKLGKGGSTAVRAYKAGKVMKSARTVGKINNVKKLIKTNQLVINKIFDKAAKNEKLAPHVNQMKQALDQFANEGVAENPEQVAQNVGYSRGEQGIPQPVQNVQAPQVQAA